MKPLQRVLAITDFSVDADHAVARAARIAADRGGTLHLLHVVSESQVASLRELFGAVALDTEQALLAAAQSRLDQSVSGIAAALGVPATSGVRTGEPVRETWTSCPSFRRRRVVNGADGSPARARANIAECSNSRPGGNRTRVGWPMTSSAR